MGRMCQSVYVSVKNHFLMGVVCHNWMWKGWGDPWRIFIGRMAISRMGPLLKLLLIKIIMLNK